MKNIVVLLVLAVATVICAPAVADHYGEFEVECLTRNALGHAFRARGNSDYPRDYYVWRQVQRDATDDCRYSGSWVCIEKGCRETYRPRR